VLAARRPGGFIGIPLPPLQFLVVPVFDMVTFAALIGTGLGLRRNPQAHKRLMLIGSIAILIPAVARWPGVIQAGGPLAVFGITDLFLAPLVAWDLTTRRRLHPATLWGGLGLVLSELLRLVLSQTHGWLTFARWLTGLAG